MQGKNSLIEAAFMTRLNRFVAEVSLRGAVMRVHVPNTGRLSELAVPGTKVLLAPSPGKYPYKIRYMYYDGYPVMIDSTYSNRIFWELLKKGGVPGLEGLEPVRREPAVGNNRFDFLMQDRDGGSVFIELKSCTLAWNGAASFPDAVSARASEHVRHLADTGRGILVLFLLHRDLTCFVPNYHTDFEFYRTLREHRHRLQVHALAAEYSEDLTIRSLRPVPVALPEISPGGAYLLVLQNPREQYITVGSLGRTLFREGYYVYAGSGKNNVFTRISRHRGIQRKKHWHIDYIKRDIKIITDIPFVTGDDIECSLGAKMAALGGEPVPGFGSSDCRCLSHLTWFREPPHRRRDFWDYVLETRLGPYGRPCTPSPGPI